MNILYLRGFNNYHKRTIIKYSTLEDYQNNSTSFLNYSGINFNPNDGIVTELIVGGEQQKEDNQILMFEDIGSPDYCVCYESTGSNQVVIKSRWFILESVRIRAGQYRLALKRDVIADHMDFVLNSQCFIKKGQLENIKSPFLFNRENLTYNQIKKKEIPLYDSTQSAWIVGYVAKNYNGNSGSDVTVSGSINNTEATDGIPMEDTPWGSITLQDIQDGISFTTVSSVNLLWRIRGLSASGPYYGNGYSNERYREYSNMAGRSKIVVKNGNIEYIDNNYGTFWVRKYIIRGANEIPLDPTNIAGNTLGEFEDIKLDLPINCVTERDYIYPQKSLIKSAQDLTNKFMAKNFYGTSVAQNFLNAVTDRYNTLNYVGDSGIMAFNGAQVYYDDGLGNEHAYQAIITKKSTIVSSQDITSNILTDVSSNGIQLFNATCNQNDNYSWLGNNFLEVKVILSEYSIQFREVPGKLTVDTVLPAIANRWTCNDQLFDIFCIPFGKISVKDDLTPGGDETLIETRADAGLAAARAMAQELGSNLYDLQILPYCPIKEIRDSFEFQTVYFKRDPFSYIHFIQLDDPYLTNAGYFTIDSDSTSQTGSYQRIKKHISGETLSYVFWSYSSHGTFDIPVLMNQDMYYQYDYDLTNQLLKKKVSSETEFLRLCSPNYNGVFEFYPAKNANELKTVRLKIGPLTPPPPGVTYEYGDVPEWRYYNVDYTYRPGNPYIHINPDFKGEDQGGVYGKDFNDVRGLICGGDFSLGYIVDAFRQYQIQNANFQNIFDRQIQNLDTNNAIAKEQTQFSSVMAAIGAPIGGAVTGGMAGAKAGGVYGAIAGAAIGGIGGIAGGVAGYELNMDWLERQQQETRSYSIDMYNYHLGNIKALPYSISRTDCLAENTRLVPFIEVYESTEAEVSNLVNVLKYNGMTIMCIGRPIDYIGLDDIENNSEIAVNCKGHACYYIQADLIMNNEETLDDDFHIMDAIYAELSKGIYLQGTEVPESEGE